jgi:hypothetical protein
MSNWPLYQAATKIVVPHILKIEGGPRSMVPPLREMHSTDANLPEKLTTLFQEENVNVVFQAIGQDEENLALLKALNARSWRCEPLVQTRRSERPRRR